MTNNFFFKFSFLKFSIPSESRCTLKFLLLFLFIYNVVKALRYYIGMSRDRSPVVSLGIFSEASDKSMFAGSTQPLKMSTRIFLGVKAAGA